MDYSIGEFSKITGLSIYTLRYYEDLQLIIPNRRPNGRRYYTENDIRWIEFIKRLKDTGMPIKNIQQYSKLRSMGDSTMKARMDLLIEHKSALETQIESYNNHLQKLIDKIDYYKNAIENNH